ncbi:MAG: Ni/Fe-hydrogenase cytochrome b subunit [Nitrospirota bacterium]|nr:MAG: Ni/Fe-hydrogenase cytochrome b subunit [Nitrospirota bacterium]
MNQNDIKMWTPTTTVLLLIMGAGGLVALYRMFFGLGAVTNLNSIWPWGFWIAFDVLGGVAMAAGGFIIAGAVYILNWKKYKPIVRPAVLNAFFGYLLAAIAIFLDIGQSFRIWHPMVMWQVNSIMFIVAIHVVLYTSTLAAESSPMIFEKLKMTGLLNFMNKIMVPVVLFGVLLSTLHQSSLGAVYLIIPSKLSPLWYSSLLPYHFLVSAVLMGLSMVSFETILSTRVFNHKPDMDILSGLAKGSLITVSLYLIMKLWDLVTVAGIGMAFTGSTSSNMYLLEMVIGVILPFILLISRDRRSNMRSIFSVNVLVIAGIVLNRMNVALFGLADYAGKTGVDYFPSWMEFALTAGMVAFAILGFKVSVKYLNLFPEEAH